MSSFARRAAVAVAATAAFAGVVACTPESSTPAPPPPAKAILSPSAGPAGSFVDVAAPNGECDPRGTNPYSSLQAALTIARTGIVVTQGYQYIGPSPSTYAGNDPFVHLRIPPATAPGVYNVFLSCYSYLDTYTFAPATFTVTTSGV